MSVSLVKASAPRPATPSAVALFDAALASVGLTRADDTTARERVLRCLPHRNPAKRNPNRALPAIDPADLAKLDLFDLVDLLGLAEPRSEAGRVLWAEVEARGVHL